MACVDATRLRPHPLNEFKQILHLKDPKDKDAELFQNISQLKARALDSAVHQLSKHTDLKMDYELFKKGQAYDAVPFTIARQPPLVGIGLGDAKHLDQLFKFTCQLKTEKVKATTNPGELLLKICGPR